MDKQWLVYILKCGDGTLYTGITDDLPHRLEMHRAGKGENIPVAALRSLWCIKKMRILIQKP